MNANFWTAVLEQLDENRAVFCALVANNTKHSPGTRGAKLWVTADQVGGTIGGGIMEHEIIERARLALSSNDEFADELLVHRDGAPLESGSAKRSGLFCAGEQQMVYAVARPNSESHACVAKLANAEEIGFVEISENGWHVDDQIWDETSMPIRFENGRYRELIVNPFRVAIFGAGHCGRALSEVLYTLGYHVEILDPRSLPAVENAKHIRCEYEMSGPSVSAPSLTHAIVMTANYPSDVAALTSLTGLSFPFIGVMGSTAKIARIKEQIPVDVNDKLTAPIGLDMVSNTPQEIAISVAAQLLQIRPIRFPWTAGG